jgi:hypothetical protein
VSTHTSIHNDPEATHPDQPTTRRDPVTATPTGATTGARRVSRLLAVGAAVVAALAVWAVAALALGIDVQEPPRGAGPVRDLAVGNVVLASAVASLAGWALLAVLERVTTRARTIWTSIAVVVAVLSLGGPLTAAAVTTANRAVLAALHVVVAAVLIPLLARTSPGRSV